MGECGKGVEREEEERNEWTAECRCSILEDWQSGGKRLTSGLVVSLLPPKRPEKKLNTLIPEKRSLCSPLTCTDFILLDAPKEEDAGVR